MLILPHSRQPGSRVGWPSPVDCRDSKDRSGSITMETAKQPSLPEKKKRKGVKKNKNKPRVARTIWLYWYNPFDLIANMLTSLGQKMFFGMARYVDEPEEIWHSRARGSSIRATSGETTVCRSGEPIIPGNIVRFEDRSDRRAQVF